MSNVVDLLLRPVYSLPQVDRVLGLHAGTARRWIDGYDRSGKHYEPVVREETTGDEAVTWGEFVETRLLSEYRDAGVPMVHMRPAVIALREELQTQYPLASARTWLDVQGQELVRKVQEKVGLEQRLALVVVRTGQQVMWSNEADAFSRSIEWTEHTVNGQVERLRADVDFPDVVLDPLRGFGEPVIRGRNVATEILGELYNAGETVQGLAETYELDPALVDEAVRYEFRIAKSAVAA
ncbi:MAG TPA: DUF433 domain-containing protein [Solirubrobacteraceae bacterium]|nr:DUF433 domain-containing protein [Solirubrobacteraceae bacterium]